MDLTQLFLDFALQGAAWVLYLLVILSVISIGVMIDRALWFRGRDTDTAALTRELRRAYQDDDLEAFRTRHRDSPSIAAQVALRGLAERAHGPDAVAEAMHSERARWRRTAERNLIVLGTLGNNVPFIGLFGTVLGVIKAFDDLRSKSADSESLVMAGIAEALVATAIGLMVAIPAVVAFNYFQRRLRVAMSGTDECAHQILSLCYADQQPGGAERARSSADAKDGAGQGQGKGQAPAKAEADAASGGADDGGR
ncbi:MAG: MotA/TolQ/ExbB proton channel family protein [Kofleriaceae bacterium]